MSYALSSGKHLRRSSCVRARPGVGEALRAVMSSHVVFAVLRSGYPTALCTQVGCRNFVQGLVEHNFFGRPPIKGSFIATQEVWLSSLRGTRPCLAQGRENVPHGALAPWLSLVSASGQGSTSRVVNVTALGPPPGCQANRVLQPIV